MYTQPLNLSKAQTINLSSYNLQKVILAAGWDANKTGSGTYDLDLAAYLLDADYKLCDNVIFFGNLKGQGIELLGDNLTGEGEGDDERIMINLEALKPTVKILAFAICIYNAKSKKQLFSHVQNSYVRLIDNTNGERELLRYNLKEDGYDSNLFLFAEMNKNNNNQWSFKAIGEGMDGTIDTLRDFYS